MKAWRVVVGCALVVPGVVAAATAPDFTAPTLGGDTVRLGDFRGRVVLLDFWASWCGACRSELPRLATLERDVPGLVVLAVNVDADRQTVERFARQVRLPACVPLDPHGTVTDGFAVPALPWQVLVDAQGRIVRQGRRVHDGAAALREELRRLGAVE